jgi:S1-C subfamily serine protease/pSer/pThr/pTyr-binding forkhead associated (FHA) protein
MRVELRITSGSRAGQRETFEKSVISIGRHPMNDVRFHPENDPDASSRHAEIRVLGNTATLHDLESTNGTFVNGQRVAGPRALFDGDLLAFGKDGPQVEFRALTDAPVPVPEQKCVSTPDIETPVSAVGAAAAPRRDTSVRIAEAVEQQTGRLRQLIIGLGALVVVGAGVAYWYGSRDSGAARAEIDLLLKRNDSLSALIQQTVGSVKGRVAGLDSALAQSKTESDKLRAAMRGAIQQGGDANVGALTTQLSQVESRQRAIVSASRVDYEAIAAKNSKAVVFIAVEMANGEVVSGSGFNVSPSGLIVTNRHVVQDEQGRPAKRVSVIFDGTKGLWKRSKVVGVSATDELAFIKIDDAGPYPVVEGVAKSNEVRVGAPVALIGYPLGASTAGMGNDINKLAPKSTMGIGVVSKALGDTLQFDAFAARGSSGSPVFDARGIVIGVLFGGQTESNGRIVYAVPSAKLVKQLPGEAAGIVR